MDEADRLEIWHGLLFGQRAILNRLTANLKSEFGLTLPQFEALQVLSRTPDGAMTAGDLGRALLYSSGSATNLLTRMEHLGLVDRTPCPDDARVVLIRLTRQGASTIARASAAHRRSIEQAFSPVVSDDEVQPLLAVTRRLVASEELDRLPHFAPPRTGGADTDTPSEGTHA